jgi:AAA15 family ATPase/GTPase
MRAQRKIKEFDNNVKNVPNKVNNSIDVLKSAVIYGRNSSGKSNFLKALMALQFMVHKSSSFEVDEEIAPYEPYLLDEKNVDQPVELTLDFIAKNNIQYTYRVVYNSKEFLHESLIFYPKLHHATLFLRNAGKPIKYGEYFTGSKKELEDKLYPNQLLLSKAGSNKIESLIEPYLFFKDSIMTSMFHDLEYDDLLIQTFTDKMVSGEVPHLVENISKLLDNADTGIKGITVKEIDPEKFRFPDEIPEEDRKKIIDKYKYQIKTKHRFFKNGKEADYTLFSLNDESTGTIKLIALGGLILEAISKGNVLVIDEMDKSLHSKLTKSLVRLFHNPKTNPKGAQLIFATHDTNLMDNELYRRDQIWFIEKEYEGNSRLYALSDIEGVRKDVPFDKWYMSGKLGSTPVINDLAFDFTL